MWCGMWLVAVLLTSGVRLQDPQRSWLIAGSNLSMSSAAGGAAVEKPSYTIDGLRCRDFAATVGEFNRVFGRWWGDGYWDGHLDVFNDIIDWPNDGEAYTLVWSESEAAREQLGHQAMARWLRTKLGQCIPGAPAQRQWQRELEDAERGRGPTLFDSLVEIIREHPQIELRLE